MLRPATAQQLQLRGGGRPNREVLRKTSESSDESSQKDDIVTAGEGGEDQDDENGDEDEDEDPELQERERMLRREVEARPYDRVALNELADFLWETCGDKEGERCIFFMRKTKEDPTERIYEKTLYAANFFGRRNHYHQPNAFAAI
jgi:hypothetical protein